MLHTVDTVVIMIISSTDLEHKPDHVWPQAEEIRFTAVSEATSLIAIALKSGQVIIWDKYLGKKSLIPSMNFIERAFQGVIINSYLS